MRIFLALRSSKRKVSSGVYAIDFSDSMAIDVSLFSVMVMGTVCMPTVAWKRLLSHHQKYDVSYSPHTERMVYHNCRRGIGIPFRVKALENFKYLDWVPLPDNE